MSEDYTVLSDQIEAMQKQFSVFVSNMTVLAVRNDNEAILSRIVDSVREIKQSAEINETAAPEVQLQRFRQVKEQVQSITKELNDLKMDLLVSVRMFHEYGKACLQYIDQIDHYIQQLTLAADSDNAQAHIPEVEAELPKDFGILEKKASDLKISRQMMQQLYTQIQLVQKNHQMAYEGTNRLLLNTVPVLHMSSAITFGIGQQKSALRHQQAINEVADETLRDMNNIVTGMDELDEEAVMKFASEIRQEIEPLISHEKGSYLDTASQLRDQVTELLGKVTELSE